MGLLWIPEDDNALQFFKIGFIIIPTIKYAQKYKEL